MVLILLTHSSPQILRTDHAQLASQWIRCKIEDHNEYLEATAAREADDDGENDVNDALEEYFHVKVGSPQKPRTFESIELEHGTDHAFDRFRIKLNNFLNFSVAGRVLLDGKKITLKAKDEVSHTNPLILMSVLKVN